jgi:hypothetical protein
VSWDLGLYAAPPGVPMEQLTEGNTPPLGPLDDVLATIRSALPEVDLGDPTWGRIEHHAYTIELNIGADDPVASIGLRVHGGEEALEPIERLWAHTGWRALDYSTGDFLDEAEDPATGLRGWRALRDSVIDDG